MILELAENGDLFGYLKKTGRFSEETANYYFR